MIRIVKCKKPRGYRNTNLVFSNYNKAKEYISDLDEKFELKRIKVLECPISKRMKKRVNYARPKKYLLTQEGKKYRMWEELN